MLKREIIKMQEGEQNTLLNELKEKRLTEEQAREYQEIDTLFRRGSNHEGDLQIIDFYYLQREPINVNYNITDNYICVKDGCTVYINIKRHKLISKKDILNKRAEIVKIAKEKRISISYKNKYKKIIETIYKDYEKDFNTSQKLFNALIKEWEYIRDSRGIHMGTRDDYYLNKVSKIKWELEKLEYRSSNISKVEEIYKTIIKILEEVKENDCKIVKIYL